MVLVVAVVVVVMVLTVLISLVSDDGRIGLSGGCCRGSYGVNCTN